MKKIIVGLVALIMGATTAMAVSANPQFPTTFDVPGINGRGTGIGLQCGGANPMDEILDWPEVLNGVLPEDTPGPIGIAQAQERVPEFVNLGNGFAAVERAPGKAKFVLGFDDYGRVNYAAWCKGEPGLSDRFPELTGGTESTQVYDTPNSNSEVVDDFSWLNDAIKQEGGQ